MTFRKRGALYANAEGRRQNAEDCLKLAAEFNEIYAKTALIELAREPHATAEELGRQELERRRSTETNAAEPNDPA